MRRNKLYIAVGSVLGSAAFAQAQQFGTLNDNFGNNALNVPATVGPSQSGYWGPYDPYEFNGVSTSEYDASANQGVPRNWTGINNSSNQYTSLSGSTFAAYYANPWTGYSWNKNDGSVIVSSDATPNTNLVTTGDRSVGAGTGIGSNWLVSAPVKFTTGETFNFSVNALASNQDYLEVRISTFATAAAAMAAPNTGILLTGSETFNGTGGTPNDGSSYQNVGDFKTVLGSVGTLDTNPSDASYGQPDPSANTFPTTWTTETMTIPSLANGMYGRIAFYYFDQITGQASLSSYAIGVDNVQTNIAQLTPNLVQWGLGVAPSQSWNNAANWAGTNATLSGAIPNGAGAQVLLGSLPSMTYSAMYNTAIPDPGNQVITLDAPQTVGQLTFDNATDSYTVSAGMGGSLTIDDTGDPTGVSPQINVLNGNHSIIAPITLANGVNVNLSPGTSLTISSTMIDTAAGTIAVKGGGTFNIGIAGVLPTGDALTIGTGSLVALESLPTHRTQTISTLSIDTTTASRLDVGNNILNISNTPVATIEGYIHGTGSSGIFSSNADAHHNVGYMPINSGAGTEVRYTLLGDTNLDGSINFTDLLTLAQHYGQSGQTWYTGDTNYDGTVNFSDLLNLAQNYGQLVPAGNSEFSPSFATEWDLAVSEASAVPEPTSLGILAVGTAGLLARRGRRLRAREIA